MRRSREARPLLLPLLALLALLGPAAPASAQDPVDLVVEENIRLREATGPPEAAPVDLVVEEPIRLTDDVVAADDPAPVELTVEEAIAVTDDAPVRTPVELLVEETVAVSDETPVRTPVELLVEETVAVSDETPVRTPVELLVEETVAVSDETPVRPPVELLVEETVAVSDESEVRPPVELRVDETVVVDDGPELETFMDRIEARLETADMQGSRGEPLTLPLVLDAGTSVAEPGSYSLRLLWQPTAYDYEGVDVHPLGGSAGIDDKSAAATGIVGVTGTLGNGLRGQATLLDLTLTPAASLDPGARIPVVLEVQSLTDEAGADLADRLVVVDAELCVSESVWGDVDGDGSLGIDDAILILRHALDLDIEEGADLSLADVDRDGTVGGGDAVHVARHLVGLPLPPGHRVGAYVILTCPDKGFDGSAP